jgi:hypothetical protein
MNSRTTSTIALAAITLDDLAFVPAVDLVVGDTVVYADWTFAGEFKAGSAWDLDDIVATDERAAWFASGSGIDMADKNVAILRPQARHRPSEFDA